MKIYLNSYIAQNLGDDLFMDMLFTRYPNHQFYAINRVKCNYNYSNFFLYSNKYVYKICCKLTNLEKHIANWYDMVVTIGGSMFMEGNNTKLDFSLGKKDRYVLGINFGPYKTNDYYNAAYTAFRNCKDVCFREKHSYELFKDLSNTRYAPDIAFGFDKSNLNITDRKRAIVSVISCDFKFNEGTKNVETGTSKYTKVYEDKMVELIERLALKENYEIVLFSMCQNQYDGKAVDDIYTKCSNAAKGKIEKYYYNGDLEEALDIFADSSLVVGTRLHANIIGMALGKPIIPFAYSDKMIHIFEDMFEDKPQDMPHIIDIRYIDDFDVNDITQEDLTKVIDVSDLVERSQEQFKELDKVLK